MTPRLTCHTLPPATLSGTELRGHGLSEASSYRQVPAEETLRGDAYPLPGTPCVITEQPEHGVTQMYTRDLPQLQGQGTEPPIVSFERGFCHFLRKPVLHPRTHLGVPISWASCFPDSIYNFVFSCLPAPPDLTSYQPHLFIFCPIPTNKIRPSSSPPAVQVQDKPRPSSAPPRGPSWDPSPEGLIACLSFALFEH